MLWPRDAAVILKLLLFPQRLTDDAVQEGQKRGDATEAIRQVRKSILESFLYTIEAVLLAFVAAYIIGLLHLSLSSRSLLWFRLFSGFVILWAIMSKVGWKIQSLEGRPLPERANELWFRFLYTSGIFLLFLTVLVELNSLKVTK